MPREVFIAGQILTAAEMNTVSDQTVMSFAGTAARGSAIPSPVEGMAAYLEDSNILSIYNGSAWKNSLGVTGGILQIVQVVMADPYTTTSNTFGDVTGLTLNITPSSTSSKILMHAVVPIASAGADPARGGYVRALRDSTNLVVPNSPGNRVGGFSGLSYSEQSTMTSAVFNYLDSPATTSAVTYKIQARSRESGDSFFVNRSRLDQDASNVVRGVATITLMEVAA